MFFKVFIQLAEKLPTLQWNLEAHPHAHGSL